MTYYDQPSEHDRIHQRYARISMYGGWTQGAVWTRRILIALAVLWVITAVVIMHNTLLAPAFVRLYLNPSEVVRGMVWQIVTSPFFCTLCIWQFIFHLFYFFIFAPKVEREWGNARFLRFYLTVAFVASMIGFLLRLPTPLAVVPASTASAPIFAVMVAYASMWPRDPFWVFGMFPSPVLYIVLFLCGLEVLFMVLYGAGTLQVDFVASSAGVVLGFATMRVPAFKALFVGEKKKRVVTAAIRAKKQEFAPESGSSIEESLPSAGSTKKSTKEPVKEKGKRSGFLEF